MVTFIDDFNRADGTMGSNWTTAPATSPPTIVNNQVVGGTVATHAIRWLTLTDTDSQFSQATWMGQRDSGPIVAAPGSAISTTSATLYVLHTILTGGTLRLSQKPAGGFSYVLLGIASSIVPVTGDVFRLEYINGVLTGYLNGAVILTHTPTNPIIGQRSVGLGLQSGALSGLALWDTWSGGDIIDPSTSSVPLLSETGTALLTESNPQLITE